MDLQIEGKKAIMAGGSAGMGRATAERLAEAGVELVISARREERLRNAAQEISDKYGAAVTPVVADSSTEDGRAALFATCPDPDILAITIKPPKPNGDFLKVTPEQWRESIENGAHRSHRDHAPLHSGHEAAWLGPHRQHCNVFSQEPDDLAPDVRPGPIGAHQLHGQRLARDRALRRGPQQPAARDVSDRGRQRAHGRLRSGVRLGTGSRGRRRPLSRAQSDSCGLRGPSRWTWHPWRPSCAVRLPASSWARTSSSMAGSTLLCSEQPVQLQRGPSRSFLRCARTRPNR